ncbi:DUF1634 domain-containing protein [Hippea alviniae]|uniref:DUF1634 domain-containing protein n=1 Tax=Hippea alviniae TaxID=1279027 RepID=UPI0003B3B1F9|nr:DUF1634 domain-containing protein [Hippea alviniae]
MRELSFLFKVVFFASFSLLGVSFCMHVLGYDVKLFAKSGIVVLLLSPILTALFSAYSFAKDKNIKAVLLSLLLILVLILNVVIS